MTKLQEQELKNKMEATLKQVRFSALKAGSTGILGAVLQMCNEEKTVEDIKDFCKKMLNIN